MDDVQMTPGYMRHKDDYSRRMKRIEGQVRGIARMVEEEKYCIDILTQVSAVTKALQAVALGLLDEHMSHCVLDAAQTGRPGGGGQAARGLRGRGPAGALMSAGTPSRSPCTVTGMTCEHCVASVTEEVQEIPGVTDVRVDLATGSVSVTSDQPLSDADVRSAVEEAGYQLA